MNQTKPFSGRSVLSAAQPKTAGTGPQSGPAHGPGGQQPPAMNATGRTPIAPPAYRPQTAPKVLQSKVGSPQPANNHSARASASGVVQANVIGGTHALQARLNAWHTRPTRSTNPTARRIAGQSADANLAHTPGAQSQAPTIQRKSGPGVEAFRVPLQPKSGGLPIPENVRAKMETAFNADFSDVRVHVGQEAASLGAIAYTWGTNIHFAPGQYSPNTIQGQKLLGHELWHVVQQRAGRVNNPFGGGVAVVQDHALEAEADRMGIKAAMTALVQKPGD